MMGRFSSPPPSPPANPFETRYLAEAVYAGLQPVFGKFAVDQAVSGDARQMGDEPQAQQQTGHQCRARV